MNTHQISQLLTNYQNDLFDLYNSQDKSFWEKTPEGKWSAGHHLIHLVQSTRPLLLGLSLPNFVIKWYYGTSNRPSRSLEEVIQRYQEKLAMVSDGVVSPFSRKMPNSKAKDSLKWQKTFTEMNERLNKKMLKFSEKDLDTLLVGHPLMGKMTLREILMWNAYHTKHHEKVLRAKYLQ
jgi:DinB superfamily